jgi:MFS family permease
MNLILRNGQFRILWVSGLINDVGLTIYITVNGWLALTLTDSAFWVGAVAGMGGLGLLSSSILAGVMVDRLDRRRLLMGGQVWQAIAAFIIAALVFSGRIELWHIMVTAYLNGVVVAIKFPSRMALVLDVAGRENLLRATAANFAAGTSVGIAIPPLAGLVTGALNIGWAYVMMGSAFALAALLLLLLLSVERFRAEQASPLQDFKEGIRYVFTTPLTRSLILMALSVEVFGWTHEIMMPVMARDVLDAGPTGLGYLLSAGNAGALASTLVMSSMGDVRNKGRLLVGAYIGFGLFLVLFAASSWLPLSLVLIALAYSMVSVYETALTTLIQTTVPDEMRGRVMSFLTLTWGINGSSGFLTGTIAALLGAPVAIAIGGGVLVVNGLRLLRGLPRRFQEPQPELAAGD